MVWIVLHIGLDDTDSKSSGCTTYTAALLVDGLLKLGARFVDYPNLIRLNPNVPWKTRGNGAVALRVEGPSHLMEEARALTLDVVESNASFDVRGTEPGVVFLEGPIPSSLGEFASAAMTDLLSPGLALRVARDHGVEAVGYGKGRGIVGALAAVGEALRGDHTFELIAYRTAEMRGKTRLVDPASVLAMDEATRPLTFNNLDRETGRVLLTPRGSDPILYGVRGETPEAVHRAHQMLRVEEPPERWVIFRTNHGTDSHLTRTLKVQDAQPFKSVVLHGFVSQGPRRLRGGHVFFHVGDETGELRCAAYEPTGRFRNEAMLLVEGDEVRLCGGVRRASKTHPRTLNLEKMELLKLAGAGRYAAPHCPKCGKRMGSEGRGKGYGCPHCGFRNREATKVFVSSPRGIRPGKYLPPPRAHRHLTKPLCRYGLERNWTDAALFQPWHWP